MPLKTVGFDYSDLSKDLKSKLHSWAGEYRRNLGAYLHHGMEMGRVLNEALEEMAKCGCEIKFAQWVRDELGISRQTAYNYVNAYCRFGGDCKSLIHFTAEAIYLLSWDNVPQEAVDTALNLASKGTRITKNVAAELKQRFTTNGQEPDHDDAQLPPAEEPEPNDEGAEPGVSYPQPTAAGRAPEQLAERPLGQLFQETRVLYRHIIQNISVLNRRSPHQAYHDCKQSLVVSQEDFLKWRTAAS